MKKSLKRKREEVDEKGSKHKSTSDPESAVSFNPLRLGHVSDSEKKDIAKLVCNADLVLQRMGLEEGERMWVSHFVFMFTCFCVSLFPSSYMRMLLSCILYSILYLSPFP